MKIILATLILCIGFSIGCISKNVTPPEPQPKIEQLAPEVKPEIKPEEPKKEEPKKEELKKRHRLKKDGKAESEE